MLELRHDERLRVGRTGVVSGFSRTKGGADQKVRPFFLIEYRQRHMRSHRRLMVLCAAGLLVAPTACRSTSRPPQAPAPAPATAAFPPGPVFELQAVDAAGLPEDVRRMLSIAAPPGSPRPEVQVGGAPERFPPELIPPGAQIVAAAVTADQVAVVARTQTFTDKQRAGEMQRLLAAGWQWWGPVRSGLMATLDEPVRACRSGEFSSTTFSDRPNGTVLIRVAWSVNPRQACTASPANAVFPDIETPALLPPREARPTSASTGSGPGRTYSTSIIQTTLTLEALSDHYGAQMEEAGWKRDGRARDGDRVLVSRFSIVSRIGDPITAILTFAPVDDTSHIVSFLMIRNAPSRAPAAR
jgi:hypothetical protein